jgi:hypothetical protein
MKLSSLIFVLFSIGPLHFCNPSLGSVEIVKLQRVYVTREEGIAYSNTGNLEAFFGLPTHSRIYSDTDYFLAINIGMITNMNNKGQARINAVIEFENFEVTNPKIESIEGGRNFDHTTTLEDGSRTKTSRTVFPLPQGINTEINYYMVYQIAPISGISEDISSKISISFEKFEKDNYLINGRFQEGSVFTINIEIRD